MFFTAIISQLPVSFTTTSHGYFFTPTLFTPTSFPSYPFSQLSIFTTTFSQLLFFTLTFFAASFSQPSIYFMFNFHSYFFTSVTFHTCHFSQLYISFTVIFHSRQRHSCPQFYDRAFFSQPYSSMVYMRCCLTLDIDK